MSGDSLESARDRLVAAAESAADDDVTERLNAVADKLTVWLEMDGGPDHGQLARVENRLHSLAEDASSRIAEEIEAAHDLLKEYRSGVEGV